jgi:hypothetical protein
MIDLIGFEIVEQLYQVDRVSQISVMQKQAHPVDVRILVEMVNSGRVKCTGSPDDTVNFVPFGQEEIRQVRAILAGNSGDKCLFHRTLLPPRSQRHGNDDSGKQFVNLFRAGAFNVQCSMFNVQCSMFNVQRSTFGVWRLAAQSGRRSQDIGNAYVQDIGNSVRGHPRNIVTFYF